MFRQNVDFLVTNLKVLHEDSKLGQKTTRNWPNYDLNNINFHSIPANLRFLVYSVGVKEGGEEEWNQAFNKYSTTHIASEKNILLESLTYTRNTEMIKR